MDHLRLCRISAYFAIALHCLLCSKAQECSPRCWNPVQPNSGIWGGTKQEEVVNEEECKELCVNNGTCIGVDWNSGSNNRGCWFQLMALAESYVLTNLNHWSLANCTGECASYCWKAVEINTNVEGGTAYQNITDENHCKLLCSKTPNCTGIDWYDSCFLIFTANLHNNKAGVRHWDIERNFPTSCKSDTSSTVSVKSTTMTPLQITTESLGIFQRSTESLESKTTGSSGIVAPGIIILAALLGICVLTIIGLVINTIRIGRQLNQKSDVKSVEFSDDYETMQRAEAKDGTYTDLAQRNPNDESIYERAD